MNKLRYKLLEERAKEKGKILLVEDYTVSLSPSQVVIYDKMQMVESVDGSTYQARGILKKVPVARYDENNKNNRKYPKKIGENIVKNKLAEGNDCFGDHAETEPSVFDTVGIWHNFMLEGNIGYADLYCIGEGGQLMLEKAKAGGKCGYSTVGYGELQEDGGTVNPDSFELDHLADWVNNPSAGVFGTYENITESKQNILNIIEKESTNKLNNIDKLEEKTITEKREINTMSDSIQVANLRNHIRVALKEATKNTNFKEAIEDLVALKESVIVSEVSIPDQIAKIDSAIVSLQGKMEEQITEAKTVIAQKDLSVKELTEKLELTDKAMAELKEQNEKLKSIIEKTTDEGKVKVLEESSKSLEENVKILTEDRQLMEEDIKHLLEDRENMEADIKVALKEREDMLFDIKKFKEQDASKTKEIASYAKKLKEAVKHIRSLEKILEDEYGYDFEGDEDEFDVDMMDDEGMPLIGEPTGMAEEDDMEDEEGLEDYSFAESDDSDEDDKEDMEEEAEDEEEDEEELEEAEEEDSEEDEKEDEEEKKEESAKRKQKAMKESAKRALIATLKQFYVEAVSKEPAVKDIKAKIFASKSLYEATKHVMSLKAKKGNDVMKLSETTARKNDGLIEYKF